MSKIVTIAEIFTAIIMVAGVALILYVLTIHSIRNFEEYNKVTEICQQAGCDYGRMSSLGDKIKCYKTVEVCFSNDFCDTQSELCKTIKAKPRWTWDENTLRH